MTLMSMAHKKKLRQGRNVKVIKAEYHPLRDWKRDPAGYFLIRIDRKRKMLEVAFCRKSNVIEKRFFGKDATVLYNTVLRHVRLTRQHAAYLGRELTKAEMALHLKLDYIQDSPLDFRGVKRVKKHPSIENIHNYCLDTSSLWTKHPRRK